MKAYQIVDADFVKREIGRMPIVDVRPPLRYDPAHIPSAINIRLDVAAASEDPAEELAEMFRAQRGLEFKGGMLVTNPIPEEYSMDKEVIDKAIEQALAECKAQGVHGKETTPFLLARVVELTGGDSLESNIQLVLNNARLAARTACALAK